MPVVNRAALLELFALGPSHTEGQTFYKNIAELPMGYALLIRDRKESLHEYFELNVHRHNEDLAATAADGQRFAEPPVRSLGRARGVSFRRFGQQHSVRAGGKARTINDILAGL